MEMMQHPTYEYIASHASSRRTAHHLGKNTHSGYVVPQAAGNQPIAIVSSTAQTMNSNTSRSIMRRSAAATLLVAAALLLSACSTTSASRSPVEATTASREPVEKPVTYEQLHGMMVKLAHENALGGAATASIAEVGGNSTLASNP
jgi:hypothetical protein